MLYYTLLYRALLYYKILYYTNYCTPSFSTLLNLFNPRSKPH